MGVALILLKEGSQGWELLFIKNTQYTIMVNVIEYPMQADYTYYFLSSWQKIQEAN